MTDPTVTAALGYDAAFLSATLPLPGEGEGRVRLDYPRFSVVLDPARRFAAVTAVNIDGAQLRDVPRSGEWHFDDRVPQEHQAGNDVYRNNDLDRGHLVRRRDPGWGSASQARAATEATFAYTNAAPQAAGFNQSKELWLGLEDHVLAYAEDNDHRTSVFTAPILGLDDPPYRGIRIPRRFYKIAAWSTDSGIAATAFVLDQSDLIDAAQVAGVAPLGAFRTFQVPIADVSALTGIGFDALSEADILAPVPASRPSPPWRQLDAPTDIAWTRPRQA